MPRLWPGETVVCLATGPSLTQADVDVCRGRARVIAINDAYRLAPFADVLFAADGKWWKYHQPAFSGLRYSLQQDAASHGATVLANTGYMGVEMDPRGLRTIKNSGGAAINLAVHLGASRVVLLGYDMAYAGHRKHFFGDHPERLAGGAHPALFVPLFQTMVEPLRDAGVSIVNCTRTTALTCFPQLPLEHVFPAVAA